MGEPAKTLAPSESWFTLEHEMNAGSIPKQRTRAEMEQALEARISSGARGYRVSVVRYLMRPPLSLRAKYVAFLLDLSQQGDHMQEVLERAIERVTDENIASLLRHQQKEERAHMQLVRSDLRRLGYSDPLPERPATAGDTALRAYSTTTSYESPTAMLGIVLMLIGVAGEISPAIVRLLGVGSVPREAMRWLKVREETDPQSVKDLIQQVSLYVSDPLQQQHVLQAAEVTGELLALGASARSAQPAQP